MTKKGFSLIELLVVISIIAILTTVAVVGLQNINKKAGDTRRLSDLRRIQIAIETYRNVNNKYPEKGTQGTDNYILDFVPIYINTLPKDPSKNHTGNSGYIYNVSTDRKSYCFYIKDTVYKPESQRELQYDASSLSWKTCRGPEAGSL
jgi:prepilin-type N-terminal cleavage/methylation domain-containing protein